jgi:hypothetical protein
MRVNGESKKSYRAGNRQRSFSTTLFPLCGLLACIVGCNGSRGDNGGGKPLANTNISQVSQSNVVIELTPDSSGVRAPLLSGYDTLRGAPVTGASCVVKVSPDREDPGHVYATASNRPAGDIVTAYSLTDVSKEAQMRSSVFHSVAASLSYAGTGDLHAQSSSLSQNSYSQYSRLLAIEATAERQTTYNLNVGLSKDAVRWFADPAQFRAHCGDRYIAAEVVGSALSALVSLDDNSTASASSMNRALSIAVKGQSANAQDIEELQQATHDMSNSVAIMSSALSGPIDTSFAGVIDASKNIRESATKSTTVVRQIALPYPRPDGSPFTSVQEDVMDRLADYAISMRKRMNSLDYMVAHPNDFQWIKRDDIARERQADQVIIDSLISKARDCGLSKEKCAVPVSFDIPVLPERPAWNVLGDTEVHTAGRIPLFNTAEYPARLQFDGGQWRLSSGDPWMTVYGSTYVEYLSEKEKDTGSYMHPTPGLWYRVPPNAAAVFQFAEYDYKISSVNSSHPPKWRKFEEIPLTPVNVAWAK